MYSKTIFNTSHSLDVNRHNEKTQLLALLCTHIHVHLKKYTHVCTHTNVWLYMLMRYADGRKKEASKVKQTTRQSNTVHPRQSLFLKKKSCLGWDSNPRHSIRSKQGQTNNKAKQHSTTKIVTFPKKNELPRVGPEPTTLYKKQARSNKQQGKATQYTQDSHFS